MDKKYFFITISIHLKIVKLFQCFQKITWSTGHYQAPVIQFLEKYNYLYIMITPLVSQQSKKTSLRKVKTDAMYAYNLCKLFYKEELEPYKKRGINLLNLRHLTRQHEAITGMYVQANNFTLC
ncbi:hypothetical protein CON00_00935 [Bacillus sp. AFS096315]|nr:hypothetical protein CON00_00935 [Bacillus sp. AFS096315]